MIQKNIPEHDQENLFAFAKNNHSANIYLLKANNRNTKKGVKYAQN